MKAKLYIQNENLLGECPVWDYRFQQLLWVDIENRMLCKCDIDTGDITQIEMESRIGALSLTNNPSVYLLALQSGLKLFDLESKELTEIANPEKNILNNRFNDGKCDSAGRFWVGSMNIDAKPGAGRLYCLGHKNNIELKLDSLSISNGIEWSIDQKYLYFIDTADYEVCRYDFDNQTGSISNCKKVITVPQKHGAPDGMCIDEEGMLWIAHWGGANVSRWNPENGKLLTSIEVPALHVSSCCFGGKNLDTLFITTARTGLNEVELKQYPNSGAVFCCKPGVKGLKTNIYQPY